MLIVGYFLLNFLMMVFDVVAKAMMVKSKIMFDQVLDSGVKSFSSWSKSSNSSNIKKSGSDHTTWELESIRRRLRKIDGSYKHVWIIPWSIF